ncbi:hypothetical protein SDC9_180510 [bioreactor metagenome]|uniref:Uncharacterized protein n=1 Tax=bioreactor metagenome TaxID=1076179 RepID=A0A645H1W3_9ZZZZ
MRLPCINRNLPPQCRIPGEFQRWRGGTVRGGSASGRRSSCRRGGEKLPRKRPCLSTCVSSRRWFLHNGPLRDFLPAGGLRKRRHRHVLFPRGRKVFPWRPDRACHRRPDTSHNGLSRRPDRSGAPSGFPDFSHG